MDMAHDSDPKTELLERLGDISGCTVMNNQVLVAVYLRPEKTKGGIYLTDNQRAEDKYQGKIGLIVKHGPEAFSDDTGRWFNGAQIGEHDWIVYRPSDGWAMEVNGVLCRMLDDIHTKMVVPNPDMIW